MKLFTKSITCFVVVSAIGSTIVFGGCSNSTPLSESPEESPSTAASGQLWESAYSGNIEKLDAQLDSGANINAAFVMPGVPGSGGTPLHIAVMHGNVDAVRHLIERGADLEARAIDEFGGTPLHWAVVYRQVDIAQMLLAAGANINAVDWHEHTPLDWTSTPFGSSTDLSAELRDLLETAGGVNSDALPDWDSEIWIAIVEGRTEDVREYLADGAEVDVVEPWGGNTPLIVSSIAGRLEIAKLLIEAGAEIDHRSNNGSTALIAGCFFARPEVVRFLLDQGADPNIRNTDGITPRAAAELPWSEALVDVYKMLSDKLSIRFDFDRIERERGRVVEILSNFPKK